MDRFIDETRTPNLTRTSDLKSNMDRFIAEKIKNASSDNKDLKSNMDRFIALIFNMF